MRHHRALCVVLAIAALVSSCGDFLLYDIFREPLEISPTSTTLYSFETASFAVTGGVPSYRFAIVSGGGSIDAETGLFVAPNVAGDVIIEVVDDTGKRVEATAHVLGPRPIVISPAATTLLISTTCQFTVSGGQPVYSYAVTSGGGSINPSTGLFTAPAATDNCVVTVTDGGGDTASALVFVLEPQALLIMPTSTVLSTNATLQFGAVGGSPPYGYSLVSGAGSVDATGLYTAPAVAAPLVMVKVTDSLGATSTASLSVVASGALGMSATTTQVEEGKTATFTAYGGTPPYTYSLTVAGSGGAIDAMGHYVAGPIVGTDIDTVEARDSAFAPASLQVTVLPAAPTALTANGSYGDPHELILNWTDNSASENGFHIERKTGLGAYALVGTVGAGVTSFVDTGLSPNTGYMYRLKAYRGALESSPSNEAFDLSN